MRASLLALAAVLLAEALGVSHGNLSRTALVLVLLGVVAVALAVASPGQGRPPWAEVALGAGIAAGFAYNALFQPGWHATHALMPAFRPVLALAAVLAATYAWTDAPPVLRRARPLALAALWLVLVALVFRAYPAPRIDVWDLQQGAVAGLLRGQDPYALAYPNTYGPGTSLLSPRVLSPDGAEILGFPYPPLAILAGVPGFALLGDVRWSHAALTLAAAAGIWLLGRRGRTAELAALLVLFQPNGFFLVEQAWTEPVVLACLVGLALALQRRPESVWPGVAAGLALAAKQYTPLLLVPLLAAEPPRARLRGAAVAAAVAAVIYVPFAVCDPAAFWHSLVEFQLAQPFRSDSLSASALLFRRLGVQLPDWFGFAAAGAVVALGWRRAREPAGALAVAALAWLVLILLAKQAFANYYGLAVGMLAAGVAAVPPPRPDGL
ncbi:MAG: glycosyltransferase 87 family protein [Anaeromyxobacteraceae bacterium]